MVNLLLIDLKKGILTRFVGRTPTHKLGGVNADAPFDAAFLEQFRTEPEAAIKLVPESA